MNSKQINYVLKIAEKQSFSAAAKELYVSQPSLSQYIGKLEEELGYEIFDRTGSPLRPTLQGEMFIEAAWRIAEIEQTLENRINDINESKGTRLSVGVSPYNNVMSKAINRFFELMPECKVEIQDSLSPVERLRMLEQGKLDICVQPVLQTLGSKFASEDLMENVLVLVVPKNFTVNSEFVRAAEGNEQYPRVSLSKLSALDGVPLVMISSGKWLRESIDAIFEQLDIEANIKVICHKGESCIPMANDGIGATIVQLSMVKYMEMPANVNCYIIEEERSRPQVAAVYMKNRYMSRAARTFIDILKEL